MLASVALRMDTGASATTHYLNVAKTEDLPHSPTLAAVLPNRALRHRIKGHSQTSMLEDARL